MTFYDDAEFAAIKLLRLADEEESTGPNSVAMVQVVTEFEERHGKDGVNALCAALARQYAAAVTVVAHHRGLATSEVIDDFERHKLDQVTDDQD